jgi:hypothetical protein
MCAPPRPDEPRRRESRLPGGGGGDGWVATEVVDASYHLRKKSVVEVGAVGDLVDLFGVAQFRERNL